MTSWFLESFPSEAADYDVTVHYKTISCLSTEILSSPFVADKELCARYHEATQIAPKVLQYLDSFLCSVDIRTQHHNKKGKAKPSQWKLRQVKRDDGASALVEKYFDVLNVDIPKTSRQAYILVDHILQSQQDTLKVSVVLSVYHSLKVEASPVLFKVAPSSWDIYIPKGMFYHLRVPCGARDERFRDCGQVTLCISNRPADEVVRLHVLSRNDLTCLSRALYFDTAEGFGDWTVVISTNAGNVLRRAHKKNPPAFNAIVEKIKYVSDFMVSCITHAHRNYRELSCGHFTDDNQKRLCGSATEVPVFSAKISRSLRLLVGNRFLINLGYH